MVKKIKILPPAFLIFTMLAFLISGCKKDDKESAIVDKDGNIYHSVVIGSQTWMMENLKTTKYRNGTAIAIITDALEWHNYGFGAYCNYDNLERNAYKFGRLYNWASVNSGILAPAGWHVASKAEWDTLINYLGGADVAGKRLKAQYLYYWQDPYLDKTVSCGFNALPGGSRDDTGMFDFINSCGLWWTSSEDDFHQAWFIGVYNFYDSVREDPYLEKSAFSVRCIKD